jgi:hypothetical protein
LDIPAPYHCSILGTCLSCAEARKILIKLGVERSRDLTDAGIHHHAVLLAGRTEFSKFFDKVLDKKFAASIKRTSVCRDAVELRAAWNEYVSKGQVGAGYWVVLTHHAIDAKLSKDMFDEVHLLSHLVGATTRAGIGRIRALEQLNAALAAKLERQQQVIEEGFRGRDHLAQELKIALAKSIVDSHPEAGTDSFALKAVIVEFEDRITRSLARAERLAQRVEAQQRELEERRAENHELRILVETLQGEIDAIDEQLAEAGSSGKSSPVQPTLDGLEILYVGGRANQIHHLKAVVENAGGRFQHHDGGIENSAGLIAGLAARSDITVFPVDCVSHTAVSLVKRSCSQTGRPYIALRNASASNLMASVTRIRALCESADDMDSEFDTNRGQRRR